MDTSGSIVERLRTQLTALAPLLEGAQRQDLEKRVNGKWSAAENLAHLGRHTELSIERVRRILAENEPTFPAYRADEDPGWPAWQKRSFPEALEGLVEATEKLVAMAEGLAPEQWNRRGTHTRFGPMTLRAWLEFYLAHEGHHFYVLMRRARGLE